MIIHNILISFIEHPLIVSIFLLIIFVFYLVKKGVEGAIKNQTSFIEFYLNGMTPKSWQKNQKEKKCKQDVKNTEEEL